MVLSPGLCWAGAGYETVTGFSFGPVVGGLVTRGLGGCGSCFSGGLDWLPYLVQWGGAVTLVCFRVHIWGLSQWAYQQVHGQVWILLDSGVGSCLIMGWTAGWTGLGLNYGWKALGLSPRAVSGSMAKIEVLRPGSGTMDECVSPPGAWLGLTAPWPWLKQLDPRISPFLDLLRCGLESLPPGSCDSRTAC